MPYGLALSALLAAAPDAFRPPAVPLVCHDPYFSIWSFSDRLTDDWPRHWTGAVNAMCGFARVDGRTYRFMGPAPDTLPALDQVSLELLPTRTIYTFAGGGIELTVTFTTPALPRDLEVLSRPVTYLDFAVRSTDGAAHEVRLYLDATAEMVVNSAEQKVEWARFQLGELTAVRLGTADQPILDKRGDNLRIDWGHAYLAAPADQVSSGLGDGNAARERFVADGTLPAVDDLEMPRPANSRWPAMSLAWDLGQVGDAAVARWALLAYDDQFSIEYFHRRLRPYWRRRGAGAGELLATAAAERETLAARCAAFDAELMTDLRAVGGEPFARIGVTAYRQCLAAHKLAADFDGTPLYFSKENFSNGCIATVDVSYPSSPFMLLFAPKLLRGMLIPILDYAGGERWPWPFAPHDLGTYPLANGQVYGGGERTEDNQMPVEECGNMLLMVGALAHAEGSAAFAGEYWATLSEWAAYLKAEGLDPENQLCTDDFAGHLARNANLSLKAILALGAYAQLAAQLGRADVAAEYRRTAESFADQWVHLADDGDGYRLAFDRPGTWSLKYNLVWDRILGLNLFDESVARRETARYLARANRFGVPLDNRADYTKSDWLVWAATLSGDRADFDALIAPLAAFLQQTPDRIPFTDWYRTTDAGCVGFRARSVIGGVYLPLLYDRALWRKWVEWEG